MKKSPYTIPEIYEIAFNFRDFKEAVDFLVESAKSTGLKNIDAMVELGCGPGQYCSEFAKREIVSFGLDISPEMINYLNQKSRNLSCNGIEGDFRNFKLPQKVKLAVCMMDTFSHLLTNRDVIDHLNSVADNLTSQGVYIIELTHPRDFLTQEKSTKNVWTMERDGISVSTDWGSDPTVDPLTEIATSNVLIKVEKDGKSDSFEFETETRLYTAGLMRALIEMSGRFNITTMYGDLNIDQPFDNSKKSWRMILVLKKFE